MTEIPWTRIRRALFFVCFLYEAKFNFLLNWETSMHSTDTFSWSYMLHLELWFEQGCLSLLRLKGTLYFLQVNQKFIPESTVVLPFKPCRACLSLPVENWIRLILHYFNRTQLQADENAVLKSFWSPIVHDHFTWSTLSRDKLSVGRAPLYLI